MVPIEAVWLGVLLAGLAWAKHWAARPPIDAGEGPVSALTFSSVPDERITRPARNNQEGVRFAGE